MSAEAHGLLVEVLDWIYHVAEAVVITHFYSEKFLHFAHHWHLAKLLKRFRPH